MKARALIMYFVKSFRESNVEILNLESNFTFQNYILDLRLMLDLFLSDVTPIYVANEKMPFSFQRIKVIFYVEYTYSRQPCNLH